MPQPFRGSSNHIWAPHVLFKGDLLCGVQQPAKPIEAHGRYIDEVKAEEYSVFVAMDFRSYVEALLCRSVAM